MHASTIRNQLNRDGYAVIEKFFRPEVCEEIKAAGIELANNVPAMDEKTVFASSIYQDYQFNKDEYFLNSNDKICYFYEEEAIYTDGKRKVNRILALSKVGHALHILHPVFRRYTYSDIVKVVCSQLGFKEPAVVQSTYIYKNPRTGGEGVAYQDATYLHTEPFPPVSFWIALDDATVQNGCLWVAVGSHKSGVHRRLMRNPNKEPAFIYNRPAAFYPELSFTPVPVSIGDCIVIHSKVVQKSAYNWSPYIRHGYTFHVVDKVSNHFSEDNWLQEGENAPFLSMYTTTPRIVPGQKERRTNIIF